MCKKAQLSGRILSTLSLRSFFSKMMLEWPSCSRTFRHPWSVCVSFLTSVVRKTREPCKDIADKRERERLWKRLREEAKKEREDSDKTRAELVSVGLQRHTFSDPAKHKRNATRFPLLSLQRVSTHLASLAYMYCKEEGSQQDS